MLRKLQSMDISNIHMPLFLLEFSTFGNTYVPSTAVINFVDMSDSLWKLEGGIEREIDSRSD